MSLLLLATTPVSAEQVDKEWSEWKVLSRGFAAQRRIPPKLDRQVDDRRQASVQERLLKLEELRERIRGSEVGSKKKARLERRVAKLERRIERLQKKALLKKQRKNQDSLWLRTGAAGLYAVSLDELSGILGQPARRIKQKIQRGRLTMSSGGSPVSWYYDRASNSVLFAGASYESFYTDQNVYR
ncbi:MAG: hypothetical protein D3908_11320, partial [Candidatus Electrothrix sp. AUS4]|nr:hypothetical protein [Candidatus Electrothrix sp. AUS4]